MLMKKILIFLLGFMLPIAMFAQVKVSGTVRDAAGGPLPGASIIQKGTSKGTASDQNGKFNLEVSSENSVLQVTFLGFESQEVKVGTQRTFSFVLAEGASAMDEVVVVGYGTQKKSDVTGALINVSAEKLTARPVNNAFEALQGKAAGVDITSNERPGEIGKIYIRGKRSLNAGNDPLYVVDGIPLASGGIETLNPRDIESIDILKDASATAIYGSRGANGVILVTTKSGKSGAFSLNYAGTVTFENIQDLAPQMSASDYITWRRWAYYNSNNTKYAPGNQPTEANDKIIFANALDDTKTLNNVLSGWSNGQWDGSKVTNTDWTQFAKQTGITQEHTLSASGGTQNMKSYISFGYLNNQGTQVGQNYERYNAKISVDITPKKWFNMGGSVTASLSQQDYGFSRTGQSSNSGPTSIYDAAKQILNIAQPYNDNGDVIMYPGSNSGIYTVIDEVGKSNDSRQFLRVLGSFYAGVDFGKLTGALDGLKYRMNFGPDYSNRRQGIYIDKSSAVRLGSTSYASLALNRRLSWTLDNIVTYDKKFGDHKIGLTLLQSASRYNAEYANMSEENVPKSSYLWNNMGAVDITATTSKASMGSGLTNSQLASYMGRINYSLKDRYLLTVSGRYDGSSVLAPGHKWAFFPSAALGWRVDQEEFMQEQTVFDQLKLRLGVGTTGNSSVSPYQTIGQVQSFYIPFGGVANALAYATNEPYYTNSQVSLANPNLGWESTTQYNLGLDFSIIKGRVSGTVDVYKSLTTDLLMDMVIPTLTGYPRTMANVGETKNHGIDISLDVLPIKTKDFSWDINVNTAYQKDEIVMLANGKQDMIDNSWFIGQSISVYYGLQSDGLWKESDKEEMDKFNANGHTFSAGMVKPVDVTQDYKINSDDRAILGNQLPSWTLGLNNTFTYKDFELSFMLYGRFGYMISTGGEGQLGMYQQRQIDYWTPENTDAVWQKPIYSQSGGDPYSGLLGFRDASFLKLRNVSLGYNMPSKICKSIGVNNLKVYAQAKNFGTIYSTIDWIDLDLGGSTFNRGWVVGLELGF
jgi:TonB-linked SusC/RagA family outer membrane protein